jgi:hypothetical protein
MEPPESSHAEQGGLPVESSADFLNRKSDHLDTLAQLTETLCADVLSAEKQAVQQDAFYSAISDIEEWADSDFTALAAQIDQDKLLLDYERNEIHPVLQKRHAEVLESLKSAVARFDKRQEKMNKKEKNK